MARRRCSMETDEITLPAMFEEDALDMLFLEEEEFELDWPDERELTEEEEETARQDAERVTEVAKLVAVDCDLTLLGIHTGGGHWRDSAAALAQHIRPVFRVFLPEVMARGINVAVVTFSPQPQLIKEALEIGLLEYGCDASEVLVMGGRGGIINGEDMSTTDVELWSAGGRRMGKNHKQRHISMVVDHFKEAGLDLDPSEIFLVDDDQINVEAAKGHGMRAVRFNPEEPHRIFGEGAFENALVTPDTTAE